MPYDEEDPPLLEPSPELNALSHAIIGAAVAVHRQLGPGFDEASYANALELELLHRDIPFNREVWVDVLYRGQVVGRRRMDFVVDERVVVEIKSVELLTDLNKAQLIAYLKLTGFALGLLINFNVAILKDGVRRIIRG